MGSGGVGGNCMVRGGIVILGVTLVCLEGLILLFDQFSWAVLIIVVELVWTSTTSRAHFMTFGRRFRSVMWHIHVLAHWLEKVGPRDPNILSFSCKEWQCEKFVGHFRGMKNYKCVS